MIDRIEKVSRVKGIGYEQEQNFRRKEEYQDKQGGKNFSAVLENVQKKKTASEKSVSVPEAYRLELSNITHSLFYEGGLNFKALQDKLMNEKDVGG